MSVFDLSVHAYNTFDIFSTDIEKGKFCISRVLSTPRRKGNFPKTLEGRCTIVACVTGL